MNKGYLTLISDSVDPLQNCLKLSGLPDCACNLSGTHLRHLKSGQPILYIVDSNGTPLAIYALTVDYHPQQIWGLRDCLLDEIELIDLTTTFLPSLHMMENIINIVYEQMHIKELIANHDKLITWESKLIADALAHQYGWKKCKTSVIDRLNSLNINNQRFKTAKKLIRKLPRPRNAEIHKPILIDFIGYPNDQSESNAKNRRLMRVE
jgi:hypothetical protein